MVMQFMCDLGVVAFKSITFAVLVNLVRFHCPLLLCRVRTVADLLDPKYFLMALCVLL